MRFKAENSKRGGIIALLEPHDTQPAYENQPHGARNHRSSRLLSADLYLDKVWQADQEVVGGTEHTTTGATAAPTPVTRSLSLMCEGDSLAPPTVVARSRSLARSEEYLYCLLTS